MYHPEGKTATKQRHVENRNPLKIVAETNKKVEKKHYEERSKEYFIY